MPREVKIEYIACDCKQGKLEELARTKMDHGHVEDRSLYSHNNIFYECDSCSNIFTRVSTDSVLRKKSENPSFSDFRHYRGKLTRKEIILYVPQETGGLTEHQEKNIIRKRRNC